MSSLLAAYPDQLNAILEHAEGRTGEGPSWLKELRRRALAIFREHGVPTPKNEEWKYTPLRTVAETAWNVAASADVKADLPFVVEDSLRVVLVNGVVSEELSSLRPVEGLTLTSLDSALILHSELVEKNLGSVASLPKHPFSALNTALWSGGLFVHFASNSAVEPVIEIIHVSAGGGMAVAPRILVVAEDGAQGKITERYISQMGEVNLVLPVTESIIAGGANVEHVRIQVEEEDSLHIGLWESSMGTETTFHAYNVVFGAALHRLDQNILLGGEHATCRLDGVVVAHESQLLDNHTNLDHAVPNCSSFEVYKQIIDDQATIVFNGKIYVHPGAQKTDAKQTNQALLLSPNATINSKPQLEIFADDVKCTHGATVGQLEETPLFYLMSRGMPKAQAQGILVYAFAAEVMELISIREVVDDLESRLFKKLAVL